MDSTVASLIVDKPAEVLEMVFMLDTVQKTESSLEFILRHLPDASQSNSKGFGVSSLVKSKLLSLLGRLVIQLGDESVVTQDRVGAASRTLFYSNIIGTGSLGNRESGKAHGRHQDFKQADLDVNVTS
jgi:hypothetical protein